MDLDPEDEKNRKVLLVLFIQQSTPDIRKKLQKVEWCAGMSVSQMTEIAYKAYENRKAKRERKKMELEASFLAVAIAGRQGGCGRERGRSRGERGEFAGRRG